MFLEGFLGYSWSSGRWVILVGEMGSIYTLSTAIQLEHLHSQDAEIRRRPRWLSVLVVCPDIWQVTTASIEAMRQWSLIKPSLCVGGRRECLPNNPNGNSIQTNLLTSGPCTPNTSLGANPTMSPAASIHLAIYIPQKRLPSPPPPHHATPRLPLHCSIPLSSSSHVSPSRISLIVTPRLSTSRFGRSSSKKSI